MLRGWDRARVSAHAPRLQGHQVWKKPTTKSKTKHYDENEAEVELEKEGAGARKKSRLVGAKENINAAEWDKNDEEVSATAPRAALTPNSRKANLDIPRSTGKVPASPAEKSLTTSLVVPRKRTNNNHIITPRKEKRQSTLKTQTPRQSLLLQAPQVLDSRPTKSMRRSGRRSSLSVQQQANTPREMALKEQASFDYQVDSSAATRSALNDNTPEAPATPEMEPSKLELSSIVKSTRRSTKALRSNRTPAKAVVPLPVATPVLQPSKTEVKSARRTTRSSRTSPVKNNVLRTSSSARFAAIEALLNSPGEAPPTIAKARALAEVPFLGQASESDAKIASSVETQITSPSPCDTTTARATMDLHMSKVAEVSTPSPEPQLCTEYPEPPMVAANEGASLESCMSISASITEISGPSPILIEASVEVGIDTNPGESTDQAATADQLEKRAVEVEEQVAFAPVEMLALASESSALQVKSVVDNESESVAEAVEEKISSQGNCAESFELANAPEIDTAVIEEFTRENATESFELFQAPELVEQASHTHTNKDIGSGFVLTDPTRPFTFEDSSRSVLEETISPLLDASDDGGADSDASEESSSSPQQQDVSSLMSPSQQLSFELDTEVAKSPIKSFEVVGPVIAAPHLAYEQEDTDMLLNFVTRVKEAKKAAAAPKRKRSLPHSPLKLPLETIQDEGSTSPTPNSDSERHLMASPSKRRRMNPISTEDEQTPRRSTRTRLPIKSQAPPPGAPSFIPIRKLGGVDHDDKTVTLRRNEDKELAALTKVNTRKNKAGAIMPVVLLEKQKTDKEDPVVRQRLLKEVFEERARKGGGVKLANGKGLFVRWSEELFQFREFGGEGAGAGAETMTKETKTVKVKKGDKREVVTQESSGLELSSSMEDGSGAAAATKKRVRVGVRSKIALGMAVNGTPAPKRRETRAKA